MRELTTHVPRLQRLAVFESVARLGSFTAAAAELGISQPAVSKHIAQLEDQLATRLFDRSSNRPVATSDGAALHAAVDVGFGEIERGIAELRSGVGELTVAMQPAVAESWFSPRLAEVRERLAPTRLRVVIFDRDDELGSIDHDVSIRFGSGRVPGQRSELLVPESVVPVTSPERAAQLGLDANSPATALVGADLVEFDQTGRSWANWATWFAAHDVDAPDIDQVLYPTYGSVVPLAISGNGVILTWRWLRGELVERGLLVEVGPAMERDDLGYHLVWPAALQRDAGFRALRTWIRETVRLHR